MTRIIKKCKANKTMEAETKKYQPSSSTVISMNYAGIVQYISIQ